MKWLLALLVGTSLFSQHPDSLDRWTAHLRDYPADTEIKLRLTREYMLRSDWDAALKVIEEDFEGRRCSREGYKLYADIQLRRHEKRIVTVKLIEQLGFLGGLMSNARVAIDSVLAISPDDVEAKLLLARWFRQRDEPIPAEVIYRELMRRPLPGFRASEVWLAYNDLLIQQERFQEAQSLLEQRVDFGQGWFYIEMAKNAIRSKDSTKTTGYFYRGLETCDTVELGRLFNDARPIASRSEAIGWDTLATRSEKSIFLSKFWKSRAPNFVDSVNYRLVEHYRRLQYVAQYYRAPRFPYYDDRGLVWIRMGPPDKIFSGGDGTQIEGNESWLYENARLHYDFVDRGGGFYQLSPITDAISSYLHGIERFQAIRQVVEERRNLHPDFERLAMRMQSMADGGGSRLQNAAGQIEQQLYIQSQSQPVKEQFRFEIGASDIPLNARPVIFRGNNNYSRVDVSYMIPLSSLRGLIVDNPEKKSYVSVRVRLLDSNYAEAGLAGQEYKMINTESELSEFIVDELRFLVLPGRYWAGIDIRNNHDQNIGIYKFSLTVPEFPKNKLQISDIQPAVSISQGVISDRFVKPDSRIRVVPNPAAGLLRKKPLNVYFEIYGLLKDPEGKTRYEVAYTLRNKGKSGIFAAIGSLFSGGKETITSVTEKTGSSATEREYVSFDMSEMSEGAGELMVTVRDLVSGNETRSTVQFLIL